VGIHIEMYTKYSYFQRELEVTVQLLIKKATITCAVKYKVWLIAITEASKQRPTKVRLWR